MSIEHAPIIGAVARDILRLDVYLNRFLSRQGFGIQQEDQMVRYVKSWIGVNI